MRRWRPRSAPPASNGCRSPSSWRPLGSARSRPARWSRPDSTISWRNPHHRHAVTFPAHRTLRRHHRLEPRPPRRCRARRSSDDSGCSPGASSLEAARGGHRSRRAETVGRARPWTGVEVDGGAADGRGALPDARAHPAVRGRAADGRGRERRHPGTRTAEWATRLQPAMRAEACSASSNEVFPVLDAEHDNIGAAAIGWSLDHDRLPLAASLVETTSPASTGSPRTATPPSCGSHGRSTTSTSSTATTAVWCCWRPASPGCDVLSD